jgi:hypothetical protein
MAGMELWMCAQFHYCRQIPSSSCDVLAANILMKTLDRGVKMVCNPVAILLENDKHSPSGLILNCIDKQMLAESICTRVALS